MVQIILSAVCIFVLGIATFLFYRARKNERPDLDYTERVTIESLGEYVSQQIAEFVRDDDLSFGSDTKFEARYQTKKVLADSVDQCIHGVTKAKNVVLAQIRYILEELIPDEEACKEIVNFDEVLYLEPNTQWEILIYLTKMNHKVDCMGYLAKKYDLDQEKEVLNEVTNEFSKRYVLDYNMLAEILEQEMNGVTLDYPMMLDIISILVYIQRYGFGIVDTLRGLDVDGFNFGTSGSVRYVIDGAYDAPYRTVNSIWVQINAKWIHFPFLDFGREEEMKRIINQLVAWGTTAPMTEKVPYKVNDAYDGARVTAMRPPMGECWACFIRKFSSGLYSKEKLLNKTYVKNWELPSKLIYFLMRSEQTTAFTGQQNTGKTSMMKAGMADVAMVNIRILEMSFELAIRELYPWKNVMTAKPTDYVTSSQVQDLFKKTDGYLSMVGEVAEDIVAARMIQFCLIASAFTIFSHHAKNDHDLINGLANSLVSSGEYEDHDIATSTVLDAIKNNVHLGFVKGNRVIEYISEIVKLNELMPYPEVKPSQTIQEAIDQMTAMQREFFTRTTDRVRFESRKIIVFNPDNNTYEANEGYSIEALERMLSKLKGQDRKEFISWYRENWGHTLAA